MTKTSWGTDLPPVPAASAVADLPKPPGLVAAEDCYEAFHSEAELEAARARREVLAERRRVLRAWAGRSAVVLLALTAAAEGVVILRTAWTRPATGVAGRSRSSTPAEPGATSTIGVVAAEHSNGLRPPAAGTPSADGRLVIRSEPAGAEIVLDGRVRGRTPATLDRIAPGNHHLVLRGTKGDVRQTIQVEPGATVSVMAPLRTSAAASGAGWLRVVSALELDVFDNGSLIGTTRSPRIMLPEGDRTLELINSVVGYREKRRVHVAPQRTATIAVALPRNRVHINAVPWAEVFVDGRSLGDTPLGNVSMPIGPHEFVFRHPQLGEKRVPALVKIGTPARVTADMRWR